MVWISSQRDFYIYLKQFLKVKLNYFFRLNIIVFYRIFQEIKSLHIYVISQSLITLVKIQDFKMWIYFQKLQIQLQFGDKKKKLILNGTIQTLTFEVKWIFEFQSLIMWSLLSVFSFLFLLLSGNLIFNFQQFWEKKLFYFLRGISTWDIQWRLSQSPTSKKLKML